MRELAKSMISFSWAMGLAGAKGLLTLAHPNERKQFLDDSERNLRHGTDAALDTLGRELRETFSFADEFQRRSIDVCFDTAKSVFSKVKPAKEEDRPPDASG